MSEVAKIEENQPVTLIQAIERAALNPAVDVDKMERLLAMQERIVAKQAEADFNVSMSSAQAEMTRITADASNPQTKSKYASYPQLDRELRPLYTKHGFSLSFDTGDGAAQDCVRVLCHVGHRGGFTRTYHADMPADGKGAKGGDVMTKTHATGSAYTYGQRYLLKLIFNIAVGADDDGNGAGTVAITSDQKETIVRLLAQLAPDDTPRFLKYMGAKTVDMIPASQMDKAVSALNNEITKAKS